MYFVHTYGEAIGLKRLPSHQVTLAINSESRQIGVAACSPRDYWDRRLGNKIAAGRADKHRSSTVYVGLDGWELCAPDDFRHEINILDLLQQVPVWLLLRPKKEVANADD